MVPISPFFETNLSWLFFAPEIILTNISLSIVPMEKTETQRGEVTCPKSLSKLVTDMEPKSKPLAFQRALFSRSFPCFLWWEWPRGGCANKGPVSYSIGQGRGCSEQQGLISALEGPVGRGWSWSKVRGTLLLLRANTVIIQLRDEGIASHNRKTPSSTLEVSQCTAHAWNSNNLLWSLEFLGSLGIRDRWAKTKITAFSSIYFLGISWMVLLEKSKQEFSHSKQFEIHWAHVCSHFMDRKTEAPSSQNSPRILRRGY